MKHEKEQEKQPRAPRRALERAWRPGGPSGPWRADWPLERTAEAPGDWADLERAEQAALLHLKSQATKKIP